MPEELVDSRAVALVTGATSGIGAEIASSLIESGFCVYGVSRRGSPPDEQKVKDVAYLSADVRDEETLIEAVEKIRKQKGRLDLLVANAGMGVAGSVEDTEYSLIGEQMDINFMGTVRTIKACLPLLRGTGASKIIVIGSIAGRIGLPFQAFYSASKFALEGLVESLRYEVAPFGIQVCIVEPGDTKTGFTASRHKARASGIYEKAFGTAVAIYEHDENKGADPRRLAQRIALLAARGSLPVRISVGPFIQRFAAFLKRIIPARLFERLYMIFYKIEG